MKKAAYAVLAILCMVSLLTLPAGAQQKLAQTGFMFLSVNTDARATGMGEAFTTVEGSATSLFYNPAGIAGMSSFLDVSINQMTWIADIRYLSGAVAIAPAEGQYGVIGLTFTTVNYGEFKFTRVAPNEQGFEDITDFPNPSAYVVGLGYGKTLTDRFAVGGSVKYAYQSLGKSIVPVYTQVIPDSGAPTIDTTNVVRDYNLSVLAFDFGTTFKTGLKSLVFGMSVSNFSREIRYERESFQLPLTFKIGISMDMMDLIPGATENHSLWVSVDAVHPRSFAEYLNIGGEYTFLKTLILRAGYITGHTDYDLTAGVGLRKFGFGLDYSYVPQKIFKDIHRVSLRFTM